MTLMHTVSPRTSNVRRPSDGLVARSRYHQERALNLNPNSDLIVVQQGEVAEQNPCDTGCHPAVRRGRPAWDALLHPRIEDPVAEDQQVPIQERITSPSDTGS